MEWEASQQEQQKDESESFGASSSDNRKRRHPNSTDISTTRSQPLTSCEILERIETPNFEELARQYPAFREAWKDTRQQQIQKHATFSACVTQNFTIALTRALLQTYFSLKLPYLEEQHLCPPIPNRFFYVHWIHTQLLNSSNQIFGLDIGAGASCIYPLLASRHFRSRMVTTEVDTQASRLARSNVQANHLSTFIQVLDVEPSYSQQRASANDESPQTTSPRPGGPLQRAVEVLPATASPLQFVMTNPPFYDPHSNEHVTARVGDGRARTNMTVSEGTYPGGEVGFVLDILRDSLLLTTNKDNSQRSYLSDTTWYSSMLGKKTSLVKIQKILLHLLGPAHVKTVEYGPGHYTRWFVAWTLEQPIAAAPNAKCPPHEKDTFDVSLATLKEQESNTVFSAADAMREIVNRMVAFCESTPGGWDLMAQVVPNEQDDEADELITLHIQETMPQAITNFVDETQGDIERMPANILDALQGRDNNFLPQEGHFLVQVHVRNRCKDGNLNCFQIQLSLFKHSARGGKAVEKIRNSLEGEICRTNRKWRKIREREQQQEQQHG
ncbi:SAM-dependent methyltransferase [Nitzschia inconspicua]|uniref:SAM-dependent methyltransferase n=1 Tax=Nitzschia inconspicua TaxID=303405 RepID=A0A9K3LN77_9STRA|nr:SAM-dependent methyltransferase [Nitzschia inconspicua]